MSSDTKRDSQFHVLLGLFIFAGLILRVIGLFYFPTGMEGDEVHVVYWGRQWIQSKQWLLIDVGDLPAWETPSAYIFGGLDLVGINPRWGAVAISFLELAMCYLWTARRSDKQTALMATAFLSLMPWHFFFSYVLGPCVAGFWTSLYLLDIKNPLGRVLGNMGGLLYYVSYRVLLVWGGLVNLYRRQWKTLGIDILSGLVTLAVLAMFGGNHLKGFFAKGSYLVSTREPIEWVYHYLNSFILWWMPPLQVWWEQLSEYSAGDVGFGFAHSLGFQTPLSLGTSLFFGWGLYISYKDKKYRDLLGLFVLSLVCVGFGPSFVHFPFILPVVAFLAAIAASRALQKNKRNRVLVIMSLVLSVASLVVVISNLGHSDKWRTFTSKTELIPSAVRAEIGTTSFVWTAGADLARATLAADRADLSVFGFSTSFLNWVNEITREAYAKKTPWVFIQNTPAPVHPRPKVIQEMQVFKEDFDSRIKFFEANVSVSSKKTIVVDGVEIGILYEIVY
ncbi:hypothetical protein AZI86_15230 [Bdellovibrio bacteriovorus]|uniref:Uncharacterized protein n=1 Tax=Bdellovibrio bacteriovorus TaxID=959 RepID=A0A150WHH5_BDEBC|nr:hypothetical protein [Bdellovibrio bacteriovorus]KYG63070.1 hypothetical protein AZI86_15230 [Bdellovibrio bacteriovorus]